MNERPIPPAAERDPDSLEILRVWIAQRDLHTSILIGTYKDSGIPEERAWGVILADTARHVARGLDEEGDLRYAEALQAIAKSFFEEIEDPTSEIEGGFVD